SGVQIHRQATVQRITEKHVEFTVGEKTSTAPADMVVVASEVSAAAELAEALKGVVPEVHVVGDAVQVDYIQGAIHTAWEAATKLCARGATGHGPPPRLPAGGPEPRSNGAGGAALADTNTVHGPD